MSFFKKIKKYIIPVILVIFITSFSYSSVFNAFFQQDEWQYFGGYISSMQSSHPLLNIILPLKGQLTHFFPLGTLIYFIQYFFFKTNLYPYVVVSLFFQLVNTMLVFLFIKKLSKNDFAAFFSSFFFLTNNVSHQEVTWAIAGSAGLPATSLILVSLILFLSYIEKKSKKYLFFSIGFLFISLLFKEISLFLYLLFPAYYILINILDKALNKQKLKNLLLPFSISIIPYVLLRFAFLIFDFRSTQSEVNDVSSASILTYIFRLFTIPLKGLSQSFIPQKQLIDISDNLVKVAYPNFVGLDNTANPYISQSIVFDLICYTVSLLIISLTVFSIIRFYQKKELGKLRNLLFIFLFTIMSFIPYIFIPGKAGYFSIFEPRDLYVGGIGAGFLLFFFLDFFTGIIIKEKKKRIIIVGLFMSVIIFFHIKSIRSDLRLLETVSTERKYFLEKVSKDYPHLQKTTVFYVASDTSYYGMPSEEKNLPVQSGFGRMLLVWYQDKEHFPGCLYNDLFLHGMLSEGYRYCDERGFGYFRNYGKLVETIKANSIKPTQVIAYEWNGSKKTLTDITKNIQEKLLTSDRKFFFNR